MGFNLEHLGKWSRELEFKVETDRVKAYAAATNDDIPEHVSGEVAPPIFGAAVPMFETRVGREAGKEIVDLTPQEALRVVHGEQDIVFHQPIRPGMQLSLRGSVVGVHRKPAGTTVVTKIETRDESGALVNEQCVVGFFRGVQAHESGGLEAPGHRLPENVRNGHPAATITQNIDHDQTYRYAPASGDHMPIHLDDAVAKSVGLPGIIVHGLCTLAFTSHGLIKALAGGQPHRIRRIAVRFSKPVFPGQQIATTVWATGKRGDLGLFAFETLNAEGDVVLKDGLIEIR